MVNNIVIVVDKLRKYVRVQCIYERSTMTRWDSEEMPQSKTVIVAPSEEKITYDAPVPDLVGAINRILKN